MRLTNLKTPDTGQNRLLSVDYVNTGSTDDIVTLAEVKAWSRVDFDADDSIKTDLINEIIDIAENELNLTILDKTVTAVYEEYGKVIPLPLGPVQSITSVKEIDEGTETTLTASDDYRLQGDHLYLETIWYSRDPWSKVNLEVVYDTGWTNLPKGIELGIKKAIMSNYQDREDLASGGVTELPNSSWKHLKRYKRY